MIVSQGDAESAFALLQIIADPKSAKAWLDKLVAEKQATLQALEDTRQLAVDAAKSKGDAEAFAARAAQIAEDHKKESDAKLAAQADVIAKENEAIVATRAQLDAVKKALDDKQAALTDSEQAVAGREKAVQSQKNALDARAATIQEDLKAAVDARAQAEDLKHSYEKKIALLDEVRAKLS